MRWVSERGAISGACAVQGKIACRKKLSPVLAVIVIISLINAKCSSCIKVFAITLVIVIYFLFVVKKLFYRFSKNN